MGITFIIGGLAGAFTTGVLVSKTKKYWIANVMICTGSVLSASAFLVVLEQESAILCYIGAAFLGLFVVSSLSVGLDFGCEVSHPVPPNNVTGVMISYSMVISAIHIISANFIFTKRESKLAQLSAKGEARVMVGILILTMVLALVFALLSKEDLRKTKIDEDSGMLIEPQN